MDGVLCRIAPYLSVTLITFNAWQLETLFCESVTDALLDRYKGFPSRICAGEV